MCAESQPQDLPMRFGLPLVDLNSEAQTVNPEELHTDQAKILLTGSPLGLAISLHPSLVLIPELLDTLNVNLISHLLQ